MTDQGGGALWRDLGPLGDHSSIHAGAIGESLGVTTRRLRFTLTAPGSVFVHRLPGSDGAITLALQGERRRRIAIDESGRARGVDVANTPGDESTARLPPGIYEVVIATRQWQPANFRFEIRVFPLGPTGAALAGAGRLRLRLSTIRPEVFATGRGRLRASLQPVAPLTVRPVGEARLRMGLQVIPSYEQPALTGLGHAWYVRRAAPTRLLRVGASSGLVWQTLELPEGSDQYLSSRRTVDDYRANPGRRVIFADRAADIYRTYTEIGVNPTFIASQVSPDAPDTPFLALTNGRYRRDILLPLPIEEERLILVHLDELLLWNNDIVRDLDDALPLAPRLDVQVPYRASFHRRRVSAFVVDGRSVRRLSGAPALLLQRLDALLPPLDGQLVERSLRVPGPSQVLPAARLLVPVFALEARLPAAADRVFGGDPADPSSGLLLSFGMTRLLAANPEMTSAAVYGTLANFEAITARPDYDPRNTAFVLSALSDRPDGTPILSPWLRDGGYRLTGDAADAYAADTPQLLRYARWSGPLPADAADEVSPVDPRWTLAAQGLQLSDLRLFRVEGPRLLLCYDWGQGAYCRQQLQGLGFSEEDLSTAPPLQSRPTDLNAGVPRPLRGRGVLALGELSAIKVRNLKAACRGRGRLDRSDLSWCLRLRGRGSGTLRGILAVTPDLTIVRRLLRMQMQSAGRLDGSTLAPTASRITGRGGLGRFKLQARPPGEFPNGAVTGLGQLVTTLSAT
jgi:hypothetical protein